MAHFHGIYHGNCVLRSLGGVLVLIKLDFRGLKGQFDVKKFNFRGLIDKIRYLRHIFPSATHIWIMPWELRPKIVRRDSGTQKS